MMSKQWLPFISNSDFCAVLLTLKQRVHSAQKKIEKNFSRNAIDPFAAIFQMAFFNIETDDWEHHERRRQMEKSLQNHIGHFHQKLVSKIQGWTDTKNKGVIDLINHERRIIVELKNKYNTITGTYLYNLYNTLSSRVNDKGQITKGYTAYLVEIVPQKRERYNKFLTATDNKTKLKTAEDPLIRRIDGASFYELVTGYHDGLHQVFQAIPLGLKEIQVDIDKSQFDLAFKHFDSTIG